MNLCESTTISVTTCAVFTDYDTKLEIFTADGTCAATTTSNYNDDDGVCTISNANPSSYAASLSDVTLGAGTYYIVVDGYGGETGNYQVDVTVSTGRESNPGSGQFDLAYELEKLRADGLTDWEIDEILAQRPDETMDNNIRSHNSYVYTPNANYNGSDSFTFSASDGVLLDTATVTIYVLTIDDLPVVENPLADITVNEDAQDTVLADLDVVFMDVDEELEYSHVIAVSYTHQTLTTKRIV